MDSSVRIKIDAIDTTKAAFVSVRSGLATVEKSVEKVKYDLSSMADGFQQLAVVGASAFAGLSIASFKAIEASSNLGESINAVNVVFKEGADDILRFGETSAKSVGLSTAAFNQMATITGALLKDTGLSMDEVANQTNELTIRAADMASVFNTDVNDAMSAINQAIRGETEAIRRYAGDVTDASLQTYLLAQGITKSTTEMTEQEKRLYRIQLIMAQTAVTAGDFANTSDSLANRQRILSAEVENLSAKIGAQLSPVLISVLEAISPMLEQLAAWIAANPELSRNIILVTGAVTGLIAVIGTLGIVIMAFNPIAAGIVLAIAGISAIVYAVSNAMKTFGLTWGEVWEAVKSATLSAIDAMLGPLDEIVSAVGKALDALAKLPGVKSGLSITKSAFRSVTDLFRAEGGPVSANQPYIVGEVGPELFVPSSSGTIVPNNRLAAAGVGGGASSQNIIFNVYGDLTEKVKLEIMRDLRRDAKV